MSVDRASTQFSSYLNRGDHGGEGEDRRTVLHRAQRVEGALRVHEDDGYLLPVAVLHDKRLRPHEDSVRVPFRATTPAEAHKAGLTLQPAGVVHIFLHLLELRAIVQVAQEEVE